MWPRRILSICILMCLLAISLLIIPAQKTQALSIDDYFVYTYNFTFNKTTVTGSEIFYVTVSGQATCKQDLPLDVTEAYMESKVVASLGGNEVVLNPNYTISYADFPSKAGETASASVQVPLSFPVSSQAGTYTVTGYIITAKVKVLGIWIPITGYLPSSQVMGTVTYQPPVLGGGGGSTSPNSANNLTKFMDENGVFIENAEALSVDKVVRLIFPKGARFTIPGGTGSTVIIKAIEKGMEPETSENFQIVGRAYNLEPEGANFSPAIRMIFSYDKAYLPKGAREKDMVIAWRDVANNKWVSLKDCKVDETANTITGSVEHFTTFAAMVDMSPPASFEVSSLSINPTTVNTGESVTISVKATNIGGRAGTLTLILKTNGIEQKRNNEILDAGASKNVTFMVVKDVPATYNIDVNGLTGSFLVKALSSPPVSSPTPSTPESPLTSESTPPASQPENQPASVPSQQLEPEPHSSVVEPFNWRLLGMSVAAGMVFGGIIIFIFILWRRRET